MARATQRSYKAGKHMAESIIEVAHLFYQNNTALHFYKGLFEVLEKEYSKRKEKENGET